MTLEEAIKHCEEVAESKKKTGGECPFDDAISRQAVIDGINEYFHDEYYQRTSIQDCRDCLIKDVIKNMPSVTPQQKTGHWIETAEEYYKAINEEGGGVNENTPYFTDDIACSECLAKFSMIDNETERFEYCPHCGAKMQEVEE